MEFLDKCGASDSGITIPPWANFHHPPSRKFPSSVFNQACSCGVYHGSHSDKVHGHKTGVNEAEVCPPVRVPHLASLSALRFPEQLLSPPSGALSIAWPLLT
jgi:hypothetical protein